MHNRSSWWLVSQGKWWTTKLKTIMWAKLSNVMAAHAEYRCRRLFNAAKFGWLPLLVPCSRPINAAKTRNPLKFAGKLGCPKLMKRSQPLVGRSSPYCKEMGKILLFNKFFDCRYVRRYSPTKKFDGAQMTNFWRFLRPAFPASRVHHADFRPAF